LFGLLSHAHFRTVYDQHPVIPTEPNKFRLPSNWWQQLSATTLARVIINIAIRMIYPFLPEFGRALKVSQETLVLVTSSRFAFSTAVPLFAGLPDRFGQRKVMIFAMLFFVAAVLLVVLVPTFTTFVLALFAASTAKNIYDPAAYAYWSERTDYARRGLVMAIYETSWSIAFLVGMPLVGWLMARNTGFAWRLPFGMMAAGGLFAAIMLHRILKKDAHESHHQRTTTKQSHKWSLVLTNQRVWSGLALGFLINAANENLLIVLGVWLEGSFGLSLTALGFASFVIGAAELIGEGGVMAFVDRMGKRRAVAWGLLVSALTFALLHVIATSTSSAMLGLFLLFLAFEFTLVATLPLMSELVPSARPQTMSVNATLLLLGRMLGALLGGLLFKSGFVWNLALGAGLNLLALAILYLGFQKK